MAHVVIVEDDRFGRSLQRQLTSLGASSLLVVNPTEAAAALEAEHPLLIVSDLRMPGLSGIQVLAMARAHFPSVRRCLTSGNLGDLGPADLALIAPCALLQKPWHPSEIQQVLEGLHHVGGLELPPRGS